MAAADRQPPALKGFTFIKALGSGGFADVYLYEQELPRRKVAVKVLHAEGLTDESRAAFVAEANLMAQLSAHPYIVSIFHADVADDGRPFFVMEYCSGPSLADRYKRQAFSVPEAIRIGIRVASAVATAHQANILHRDIKPANVLTNDFGWPALTDFGISSAVADVPSQTVTRASLPSHGGSTSTGSSVGLSVPWSPPEMFEDVPRPDVRSDVYSLAATVYTLLAGHTPFEVPGGRNQTLDLIGRIERGAITPLARDDVPASLLSVLKRGMASETDRRFASAVEFARALQRVELELEYQPTAIDVPNLVVPEQQRVAGPDEDRTRARGVTTVAAQAAEARPRTPASPADRKGSPQPSAALDATVMRKSGAVGVDHASGAATDAGAAAAEGDASPYSTPRSRGGRIAIIGSGIVVVAAIVAGVVLGGGATKKNGPEPTETGSGPIIDPLGGETVPAPVFAGAAATGDGSSVTFTWTNPDPVEGDSYVWQRTDGAGDPQRNLANEPSAVVTGVSAGVTVCVDVWIRRDESGVVSAEPMAACYP